LGLARLPAIESLPSKPGQASQVSYFRNAVVFPAKRAPMDATALWTQTIKSTGNAS